MTERAHTASNIEAILSPAPLIRGISCHLCMLGEVGFAVGFGFAFRPMVRHVL